MNLPSRLRFSSGAAMVGTLFVELCLSGRLPLTTKTIIFVVPIVKPYMGIRNSKSSTHSSTPHQVPQTWRI